jgi:imidazole glycerol-phosphate synthase subunit HisH
MLVIVDYGIGNLTSIQKMLKKGGVNSLISGDPEELNRATKILLPGMGHFDNCMKKIRSSGLVAIIEKKIFSDKVPLLGICVGLQMLMEKSEEGQEKGFGWIKGETVRFDPSRMKVSQKIPNMGWLDVLAKKESPIWHDLEHARFYFAHSFYVEPKNPQDILLKANYGYDFTVGIECDNIVGVQFHPEKSHRFGMQLLKNFSNNC